MDIIFLYNRLVLCTLWTLRNISVGLVLFCLRFLSCMFCKHFKLAFPTYMSIGLFLGETEYLPRKESNTQCRGLRVQREIILFYHDRAPSLRLVSFIPNKKSFVICWRHEIYLWHWDHCWQVWQNMLQKKYFMVDFTNSALKEILNFQAVSKVGLIGGKWVKTLY